MSEKHRQFAGGCRCGSLRYQLRDDPLFVHACHCLNCQKSANSVFGITTIVLEKDIDLNSGKVVAKPMPEAPHRFMHVCGSCGDHIFTTATNHPATALLKTGTLDDLRDITINAHISTKRKHEWLALPENVPQFQDGYDRDSVWPRESLERLRRAIEDIT